MRGWLDRLYNAAGYLAAFFLVGTLVFVLIGVTGRMFNFYLRGTDAYAGYCMAASGFLALAHTLRRGEHIRVTLLLNHAGGAQRALELWCYFAAALASGLLAWFSVRLSWQSYAFHDISTGNDATPLWLPQLGMAIGTTVLFVAFVDSLVAVFRNQPLPAATPGNEPAHIE